MDSASAMMMMLVLFVPGSAVTNQQPLCGSGPGETSCASALDQPKSSGLFQGHASKAHMFVSAEKEYHGRREETDPEAHHAHSSDGPRSDVLLLEKQEARQALRDGNGLNANLEAIPCVNKRTSNCDYFARRGDCESSPYVKDRCQRSCGLCPTATAATTATTTFECLSGWSNNHWHYGSASSPCNTNVYIASVDVGNGYYIDPGVPKGWCRTIDAAEVSAIRDEHSRGLWTISNTGQTCLPKA